MANDPVSPEDRWARLQRVRDEIERELDRGGTFSPEDWLKRYPELEPELGVMLRKITATGRTQAAGRPLVVATGDTERIDTSPSRLSEATPAETVATSRPSKPPERGGFDVTRDPTSPPDDATTDMTSEDKTAPGRAVKTGPVVGQKVHYIGDYETISVLGQGDGHRLQGAPRSA